MRILSLVLLLLVGCEASPTYKCIDGSLYVRYGKDQPWRQVDGAPSHAGFTPTPCKPIETEDKQ